MTGCGKSKKVTRFTTDKSPVVMDTGATTTTITKIEDGKKVSPMPISIPSTSNNDATGEEVPFAITSSDKNVIQSDKGYHLIQGTTPADTDKIVVNDYALSKYKSGETKWSYIAAVSLGTLKKGENKFTVSAIDKKGNELASETVTIVYQGLESGTLTDVGSNMNLAFVITGLASFAYFRRQRKNA